MKENRKRHRASILDEFTVVDIATGETLGSLRNISESGLMIMGQIALEPEHQYRLSVQLPRPTQGRRSMELPVTCQWHYFDEVQNVHKSGFRFANLNAADQEMIIMLQTEYEFETAIT